MSSFQYVISLNQYQDILFHALFFLFKLSLKSGTCFTFIHTSDWVGSYMLLVATTVDVHTQLVVDAPQMLVPTPLSQQPKHRQAKLSQRKALWPGWNYPFNGFISLRQFTLLSSLLYCIVPEGFKACFLNFISMFLIALLFLCSSWSHCS